MGRISFTEEIRGITTDIDGFVHGENYHFYMPSTRQSPQLYQQLLSTANSCIDIWDPYFTKEAAHVFDLVQNRDGLHINILTRQNIDKTRKDFDEFIDEVKNILKRNKNINTHYHGYFYTKKKFDTIWHDRYLIIDKEYVYLVGTSIDEQINPVKSFGIHQIEKKGDKGLILEKFEECKCALTTTNGYRRS